MSETGTSALDEAIENSVAGDEDVQPSKPMGPPSKPKAQEEQGSGPETVTMERHGRPPLPTERPRPKQEAPQEAYEPAQETRRQEYQEPYKPELERDLAMRQARQGSRVAYGETTNPWYLVSSNDGITVMVMSVGGDDSLLMTQTPNGISQTLLLNRKFGACHDAKGQLDGTHELYPAGNQKPMHLSEPEIRRVGAPRPGLKITG
jgi:hypothetical protein